MKNIRLHINLYASQEVERMREHFEERVREMEKRYSTRVSTLRNDLQLR